MTPQGIETQSPRIETTADRVKSLMSLNKEDYKVIETGNMD